MMVLTEADDIAKAHDKSKISSMKIREAIKRLEVARERMTPSQNTDQEFNIRRVNNDIANLLAELHGLKRRDGLA